MMPGWRPAAPCSGQVRTPSHSPLCYGNLDTFVHDVTATLKYPQPTPRPSACVAAIFYMSSCRDGLLGLSHPLHSDPVLTSAGIGKSTGSSALGGRRPVIASMAQAAPPVLESAPLLGWQHSWLDLPFNSQATWSPWA